jgi:hypothetical protein
MVEDAVHSGLMYRGIVKGWKEPDDRHWIASEGTSYQRGRVQRWLGLDLWRRRARLETSDENTLRI